MAITAPKLKEGDEIRVIAPARSIKLPFITKEVINKGVAELKSIGLNVSFGKHVEENNAFGSSSIESRLDDLNDAFKSKNVKAIITVIGGFNSNQLLDRIDYDLIRSNPKILVGHSDITALQNAIYKKTQLITYSGPHFFTFGYSNNLSYTKDYFVKCLFESKPFFVEPANKINEWSLKESKPLSYTNSKWWILKKGNARGKIIGANLCTLNLLQGTEFMPSLKDSILFIEDDGASDRNIFDRDLQSLLHQSSASGIRGIVIGRFQKDSNISREILKQIIKTKHCIRNIPVLANVDFGHTYPMITYPIGGTASLGLKGGDAKLQISKH